MADVAARKAVRAPHCAKKPPSTGMLTPAQVLSLTPAPSYIQYQ